MPVRVLIVAVAVAGAALMIVLNALHGQPINQRVLQMDLR